MAKQRIFGVLENPSTLLEPISEARYQMKDPVDSALTGCWVTVRGNIADQTIEQAEVTNVEKSTGRAVRAGVLVDQAPNLPPEANGAGGYLYQEKKGRYFLLSSGPPDEPVQGDFSQYIGQQIKASGVFGAANYILYQVTIR